MTTDPDTELQPLELHCCQVRGGWTSAVLLHASCARATVNMVVATKAVYIIDAVAGLLGDFLFVRECNWKNLKTKGKIDGLESNGQQFGANL